MQRITWNFDTKREVCRKVSWIRLTRRRSTSGESTKRSGEKEEVQEQFKHGEGLMNGLIDSREAWLAEDGYRIVGTWRNCCNS